MTRTEHGGRLVLASNRKMPKLLTLDLQKETTKKYLVIFILLKKVREMSRKKLFYPLFKQIYVKLSAGFVAVFTRLFGVSKVAAMFAPRAKV